MITLPERHTKRPVVKRAARHVRKYDPLKRDRQAREIPCAWDTETDGLNGELLALSYATPDSTGLCDPDNLAPFFEMLERYPYPHVWYAHNAQYDWRYILPQLLKRYGHKCTFYNRSDADIFAIRCRIDDDRYIDMRDSAALWQGSLKTLLSTYAPDTPKLDLDFSKTIFDIQNPEHRAYAIRDAEGLRLAMIGYRKTFHDLFSSHLGFTTAGSALKAWRQTQDRPHFCLSRAMEKELQRAYFGGLVFLTDNIPHEHCETFDISSSYPAAMLIDGVPHGRPIKTKTLRFDKPGFWRVVVQAPHNIRVPILPTRDEDNITRWPSGCFETMVSSIELALAIKHGYKIREVKYGFTFDGIIKPFDHFVNKCRHIRQTTDKKSAQHQTAKLMQNSLYGKFGTKFVRKEIFAADPYEQDCSQYELLPGLDLYAQLVDDEQTNRMVHWAAWITAAARVRLLDAAYSGGVEHVLYGDTDSLTVTQEFNRAALSIGTDYGQWQSEKIWAVFRAHAPKVYAGIYEDGTIIGKAKGLPKKAIKPEHFQAIYQDLPFALLYDSVPKLTAIIKGREKVGAGVKKQKRHLTDITASKNWQVDHGKIRPRPLAQKV